jgi:hypothetical protein
MSEEQQQEVTQLVATGTQPTQLAKLKKRGRPTIGDRPLTPSERMKRSREKNKANTPAGRREAERNAAYLAQKAEDFERAETIRLERELVEDIIYGLEQLKDGVGDGGDYAYLDDLIDEYLSKLEKEHDLHHGGWDHVEKFERFYFDLITTEVGRAILTHLGVELPPELPDGWVHYWIHGDDGWNVVRKPYCWPRLPFAEYTGNEQLLAYAARWDRVNPPVTPENSWRGKPLVAEDIGNRALSYQAFVKQKKFEHEERMGKLKAKYRTARGKRVTGLQAAPKNDPLPTPQAVESPVEPSLNSGQ